MQSDYSTIITQGLIAVVLAVGIVATLLAAKRLDRGSAWLCGAGCAILFTTQLLQLLWATGSIRLVQPPEHLLGKLYEAAMQLLPLVQSVGLALLIGAALRRKSTSTPPRTEHPAPEPVERPRPSFFRRSVAIPLWAAATIAVAVAGVVLAVAAAIPTDDAVPRLVQGAVIGHSDDGRSFVFKKDGADGQPQTLHLNSRFWIDRTGAQRNDGKPACLQPDATAPHRVELAFLDVTGSRTHNFGDFPYLLSIHCL